MEDILQKMQSQRSGKKETKVQSMLKKALQGDNEATKYLDVQDRMIVYKKSAVVTWNSLCADYEATSTMFVAAENLDLEALTRTCVHLLKYITYTAKHMFDKTADDLATTINKDSQMRVMQMLTYDLPPAKLRHKEHQVSSEEDDEDQDAPPPKKIKVAKKQSQEDKDGESENDNSDSEEDEEDDEPEEESEKESKDKKSQRSHHKVFKCYMPQCSAKVGDLKRHLLFHVKKKEIDEESLPKALAIIKAGKKQRGPSISRGKSKARRPGRLKKWCPVPGCFTITHHMDQHLRNCHKLKRNGVEYSVHLKSARRYTGLAELELLLPAEHTPEQSDEDMSAASDDDDQEMPPAYAESDNDDKDIEQQAEMTEKEKKDDVSEESSESAEESEEEEEEESSEEFEKPQRKEEYFSQTSFESYRHQWLCGFFRFLHLPDAGYKKTSNRLQHVGQVRALLESLDPKGEDITVLAKEDGDIVWTKWVHPHLSQETKAPGTLISYLTSLEKFLTFVTSKKSNRHAMPPLHESYREAFKELIPSLKGWRSTVDSETQATQFRGHLRECDTLLTSENLVKLKESPPYVQGMKALTQAKEGKQLSLQEFSDARDLLLVKFTMLTGTRPMPLANATLDDYETAKEKDGNRIILVPKHKRSKQGPAVLGMDTELQGLMKIYIENIRPQIAAKGVTKIFVKQNGQPFKESRICRRMVAFWEKSGVREDRSVTHTAYRKMVTTATFKHAPEQAAKVQRVMSHSDRAAKNSYLREDLTETGSDAMKVIADVTSKLARKDQSGPVSDSPKSTVEEQAEKAAPVSNTEQLTPATQEQMDTSEANPVEEQDTEDENQPLPSVPLPKEKDVSKDSAIGEEDTNQSATSGASGPSKISPLTQEEKRAIKDMFAVEIETGEELHIKTVRNKMCTRIVLRKLVNSKNKVKQVQNHVNYLIQKKPALAPKQLPAKRDEWDIDADVSEKSGPRQAWDDVDTKQIIKAFKDFKSCPSKDQIRKIFNSSDNLFGILEKEGFTRCYEKVKSIKKKKKN